MHDTDETEHGQRLHQAIRAALETSSKRGRLLGSAHEILENTLSRLDQKLGAEATGVHYSVESAPDHCVVVAHSSDPDAIEVVASFMQHAGASTLGSAKIWLLPLDGIHVNRWLRALRRVLTSEQRTQSETSPILPIRLTAFWAREGELVMADIR